MEQVIYPFILAAVVSTITTAIVVRKGRGWGIIDDPATHKHSKVVHEKAVPRGGGVPIFAAFLTIFLFTGWEKKIIGVTAGAAVLAITGFLDDKYEEKISPYLRLGLNAFAAVLAIGSGIGIAYITNPGGGVIDLSWPRWCVQSHCVWILADALALVWLVGLQNIVGWSSGVDGQMPGFVIIAAGVMAILASKFGADASQQLVMVMAAVVGGAYAGFLPWNWYPQKIIPGYGGKSLAGFLLGVLAIFSGAKVGALTMALGIPIIDAAAVIIKRLKEGRSPVWGGREHLHHFLLEAGWGKRRIALFYWLTALILGIAALQLNSGSKYFTMATVALVGGGAIVWLHYFSTFLKPPGPGSG